MKNEATHNSPEDIQTLRDQLEEAHEIINAIRKGEVDGFIVKNNDKHEVYTLKSADKAYRIFIEKMHEGALTLNKEGIILYSNTSFANLVNMPLEKVIGLPLDNVIPAKYRDSVNKLVTAAWEEHEGKAEIILPGKNEPVPVLLSMNIFELDGGMALSILATDLTLQKEAQEQRKAIEQKDEFITIASHELKTPVTSIKGYVQLLQFTFEQEGNAKAAEVLSRVDVQINKLTTLINDLLDVKKIENGQLQYHQELFDFNDVVKETVEETGRVLRHHVIKEEFGETAQVYGDRNKIGQVITNFIDNAGKYSSTGSVIVIRTARKGNSIRLEVKDTGIGIDKSKQEKIFERFFRAIGEKENTYAGLGLGLYISAELIRRHSGTIGVESEVGKGSTFYFEIPVVN